MPLPDRLRISGLQPVFDLDLTRSELYELLDALLDGALDEVEVEFAFTYLEANLPGAKVQELIEWPGKWFGNRWCEEEVLSPDDLIYHLLERCGRVLRGDTEHAE